jgi:hypothetical protein
VRRPGHPRSAADQPTDNGHSGHSGREAGQRRLRGAAHDQAGHRAAGAGRRLKTDQSRENTEPLATLQQAVTGAENRVRGQRERNNQRFARRAKVQGRGDRRRGGQPGQADGQAHRRSQPERAMVRTAGREQGDRGLQAQRRDDADHQDRHQRAELTERPGCQEPRGNDSEQVAGHVAGHQSHRDGHRLPAERGGHV